MTRSIYCGSCGLAPTARSSKTARDGRFFCPRCGGNCRRSANSSASSSTRPGSMSIIGPQPSRPPVSSRSRSGKSRRMSCRYWWHLPRIAPLLHRGRGRDPAPRGWEGEGLSHPNGDALLFEDLLQFTGLVYLADDVAAADELALDVELRDRRPVRKFLDSLADSRIGKDVDAFELDPKVAQDLNHCRGEAALRKDR